MKTKMEAQIMNIYLPGFEPDFDVKQELRFVGGILDLRQFDKIFISVSGGKDSHAMLFTVAELADKQMVPRDNLIMMYADTGAEWTITHPHIEMLAKASGIKYSIVKPVRPMIEKITFRIKRIQKFRQDIKTCAFPNAKCRYCTSAQKVAPMDKFMRRYTGKLLKITGERWAESKARSNYAEFVRVPRISTAMRTVYGWRPMLAWSEEDIWAKIKETGVERHACYDMGCSRLGCAGCIFSGDHELKIEMRENPHIFEALDKLEVDSGFTMSMDRRRIRERIKA